MAAIKVPEEEKNALANPVALAEADDLLRLEEAASGRDARLFEQILGDISWDARPASDFLRAVHLALKMGAYKAVQHISALGKQYHPDDEQIQKYAYVLAPPRTIRRKASSDSTIRANRDWLMSHGDEYRGKWVGLRNGELLGSADSLSDLIQQIGDAPDILMTTVF